MPAGSVPLRAERLLGSTGKKPGFDNVPSVSWRILYPTARSSGTALSGKGDLSLDAFWNSPDDITSMERAFVPVRVAGQFLRFEIRLELANATSHERHTCSIIHLHLGCFRSEKNCFFIDPIVFQIVSYDALHAVGLPTGTCRLLLPTLGIPFAAPIRSLIAVLAGPITSSVGSSGAPATAADCIRHPAADTTTYRAAQKAAGRPQIGVDTVSVSRRGQASKGITIRARLRSPAVAAVEEAGSTSRKTLPQVWIAGSELPGPVAIASTAGTVHCTTFPARTWVDS